MKPSEIGNAYDQITHLWESEEFDQSNGIAQHKRAISFAKNKGLALDVGCGCTGRLIELLKTEGFSPEGIDISKEMIKLAKEKHPEINFYLNDIYEWQAPHQYDFITAWDSVWHTPLNQQANVITKLVSSLNQDGILIFSFGGIESPDEHTDASMGTEVYYSSLGVTGVVNLLIQLGCQLKHLEFDQHPELHSYVIVQKA